MKATVIADASFCSRTLSSGWAFWITLDGGVRIKRSGNFKTPPKDSAQAERWALLNGLKVAILAGADFILLQTDCMSVVTSLWVSNSLGAKKKILREIGLEDKEVNFKTRHVKGHTYTEDARSYVNRWCDEQAKKHMRMERDRKDLESSMIETAAIRK